MSETIGGYEILVDAPPSPSGAPRKKVRCTGCKGTCVRDVRSIQKNKRGCIRCRNERQRGGKWGKRMFCVNRGDLAFSVGS